MHKRLRGIWFECFSFVVALMVLQSAYQTVCMYLRKEETSLSVTGWTVGIHLVLAFFLFRYSLRVGSTQRRRREAKKTGQQSEQEPLK